MKRFSGPGLRPGPRLGRSRGPHASAFARTDSGALRRDLAEACRSNVATSGGGPLRSLAGALCAPLTLVIATAAMLAAANPHEFAPAAQAQPAPPQPTAPAGQAQEPRRRREVSPEDRAKIEAALPAKALAAPRKPRKLLVFDWQVNYGGHASIPYANLAMQLMGEKTGAFTATLSSEPGALAAANLQQYDAVYLNNTVGDIFDTPEIRAGFVAFVANGGGVVGNHGTSVASPKWTEFGEILGAAGASHREPNEKATINIEDPTHPITRAFDGKPFEYADEHYRLGPPYSRDKVRVLLSLDPIATDMMQGRCFGQCLRDDNDYPVAWIRQHGKGRVFYTTLGHNPDLFWEPRMLAMFLAGTQYALGDLEADATPRPRGTRRFDTALAAMTQVRLRAGSGPGAQVRARGQPRRRNEGRRGRRRTEDGEGSAEQGPTRRQGCDLPAAGDHRIIAFETSPRADAAGQGHRGHGALRAARAAGEMSSTSPGNENETGRVRDADGSERRTGAFAPGNGGAVA